MMYPVTLLTLLLVHVVPALADDAFFGCFAAVGSGPASFSSSADACSTSCQTDGYYYAYYAGSSCVCSNDVADVANMDNGDAGACPSNDYDARVTTTSFSLVNGVCYHGLYDTETFTTVANIKTCFTQCASYSNAIFNPTSDYNCACTDNPEPDFTATCGDNAYFIYQHSATAQASTLSRRRLRDRLASQQKLGFCPPGKTACSIENTSGYECVDTDTEFESCGGCLHGEYGNASNTTRGQDCSSSDGLFGAVTCTSGRCVASACVEGMTLHDGACF
ncbi:hypothetical protein P7C73_g1085, partial [Tremellales sp. Uapishka_1]